jgi:flagellar motor switch protein FliM
LDILSQKEIDDLLKDLKYGKKDIEKLKYEAQSKALHIADVSGSALFNADCMDILHTTFQLSRKVNKKGVIQLQINVF